jgi:hypothetical protein
MANPKVALVLAVAAGALAAPGTASAQIDPGVVYDPGSPAGKEYAIPLAEGRSDAAGTSDPREGANIPFGVGIKPTGGKGGGKPGGPTGATGGSGRGARGEVPGAKAGESSEELAARIARAEEPSGTAARTFLLALAVLLPAALLALVLMRKAQLSRTGRTA